MLQAQSVQEPKETAIKLRLDCTQRDLQFAGDFCDRTTGGKTKFQDVAFIARDESQGRLHTIAFSNLPLAV